MKQALLAFCEHDLRLKEANREYRKRCEQPTSEKNRAAAQLLKIMNEDDVDVLELKTGGYLCRKTTRAQCALTPGVVRDAVEAVMAAPPPTQDVDTLSEAIREQVKQTRLSTNTSIEIKDKLPRVVGETGGEEVKWADAFALENATIWAQSRDFLAQARKDNAEACKVMEVERQTLLDSNNVRSFMKHECGEDGKMVTLPGQEDKFKLRYSTSKRQNPPRDAHVRDGIAAAVARVCGAGGLPADATQLTELIMELVRKEAGVTTSELYSLSARPGRKRKHATDEE